MEINMASPTPDPSASLEFDVITPELFFSPEPIFTSPAPDLDLSASPEPIDGELTQEILQLQPYDDTVLLEKLDQIHQDLFMVTVVLLLLLFRGILKRYSFNVKGR